MTLIRAGAAVLDGRVCRPAWVRTVGSRIDGCGAGPPPVNADGDIHELPDSLVVPGFVDIHVHGGGGAAFTEDPERAAGFHRRHGTTSTLASVVTLAPAELLSAVRDLARATRAGTVAGIHLEGPWLSRARCGAHDAERMRAPDPAEIDAVLTAGDGAIRMVTLAPELPGSDQAIKRFIDSNVVVAVGHTDAGYDQTRAAVSLGATVGTHLFNAMRPLHHRDPGPALALLQDPRVTVELIADGVHVHPEVLRAVIATVGPDRVAAVTDALAAAGCDGGSFRLGPVDVEVVSGVPRVAGTSTIAGSTATMDRLFRALIPETTDAALAAAVRMTSTTPARAVGLAGVGAVAAGYSADLVVLDRDLQVTAVMANGAWTGGVTG